MRMAAWRKAADSGHSTRVEARAAHLLLESETPKQAEATEELDRAEEAELAAADRAVTRPAEATEATILSAIRDLQAQPEQPTAHSEAQEMLRETHRVAEAAEAEAVPQEKQDATDRSSSHGWSRYPINFCRER